MMQNCLIFSWLTCTFPPNFFFSLSFYSPLLHSCLHYSWSPFPVFSLLSSFSSLLSSSFHFQLFYLFFFPTIFSSHLSLSFFFTFPPLISFFSNLSFWRHLCAVSQLQQEKKQIGKFTLYYRLEHLALQLRVNVSRGHEKASRRISGHRGCPEVIVEAPVGFAGARSFLQRRHSWLEHCARTELLILNEIAKFLQSSSRPEGVTWRQANVGVLRQREITAKKQNIILCG